MAVFGVAFLVAVVLLGIYGLRVRAARLRQAESAIAELEDALRHTGAAIGRVESEIATVTDALKASLTPPEPAPKAERPTLASVVFRFEHAPPALRYYLASAGAEGCLSLRDLVWEWAALRPLLFRHVPERYHEVVLLRYLLDSYHEGWKAGSELVSASRLATKTAKGRKYSMVHPGQAPYCDAEWSGLTCPAPSW